MLKCTSFSQGISSSLMHFERLNPPWRVMALYKYRESQPTEMHRSVPLSHTLLKLLGKLMLISTDICFIQRDQGMDLAVAHSLTSRSLEHIWLLLRLSCVRLTFQQLWPLQHYSIDASFRAMNVEADEHETAFTTHFSSVMQHIAWF